MNLELKANAQLKENELCNGYAALKNESDRVGLGFGDSCLEASDEDKTTPPLSSGCSWLAPVIEAHQTSIDVGGAYFHGTPPALEDGGRTAFAVVPYWPRNFGPYPEKNPNGTRNLLRITGNMPGRCDAERIWQARFDLSLRNQRIWALGTI